MLAGDGLTGALPDAVEPGPAEAAQYEMDLFDVNGDSAISIDEISSVMQEGGVDAEDATEFATGFVHFLDSNGDSELNVDEIMAQWTVPEDGGIDIGGEVEGDPGDVEVDKDAETLANDELAAHDTDKDGYISNAELTAEFESLGVDTEDAAAYASGLISVFDADGDSKLSYDELVTSWGGPSENGGTDIGGEVEGDPGDVEVDTEIDTSPDVTPDISPDAETLANDELAAHDTDKDGYISNAELTAEFESFGMDTEDAAAYASELISVFDADGDNQLSHSELVTSWGG